MRVAALDAAAPWGSVALLERDDEGDSEVVAVAGMLLRQSHAAHLLALLDALLRECGWARSTIDLYGGTRGPGSFTGIRVGLGTLRGLALASGRPCVAVGTLEAMAEAVGPRPKARLPILNAGRGEVFGACYDPRQSPPREIVAPWVGPISRLRDGAPGEFEVFGPGAEFYRASLAAAGIEVTLRSPTAVAAAAGRLALMRHESGASSDDEMTPLYLRPPDAEIKASRA